VYVHREYVNHCVPMAVLGCRPVHRFRKSGKVKVYKWNPDTLTLGLFRSPNFNQADEPDVGNGVSLTFNPDALGSRYPDSREDLVTEIRCVKPRGQIYHHKWLFVTPMYMGFNVEDSVRRSRQWMSRPGIEYSKIGYKKYWEAEVVPKLTYDESAACDNCGSMIYTWRNSSGETQCDNCGHSETT